MSFICGVGLALWISDVVTFLFNTITLYRRMPFKALSRAWGQVNDIYLPIWLRKPIIQLYVWAFSCKVHEAQVEDLNHYRNLGEFFRRQLKPHVRPVDQSSIITSPADGTVLHFGTVERGSLEQVKGVTYSLQGFLGPITWRPDNSDPHFEEYGITDKDYQHQMHIKQYHNLYHCVVYLSPGDYHRFHSPVEWTVNYRRHFPGELLSVNPGVARWIQGLFNFNERAVYYGQWQHGFFSMTAVGATNVGSIKIYCDEDLTTNDKKKRHGHFIDRCLVSSNNDAVPINKGEMFGEFNLGSTIVLVFEAPDCFHFKIKAGQKIQFGEPIGTCKDF